MNILINLIRIILRARIIIFLFLALLSLDGFIFFYYPEYRTDQDIHLVKRTIIDYFNVVSEIITDQSGRDDILNEQLISFLKFNPEIKYIAIPDSNKTIIFPEGFISMEQITHLQTDQVNDYEKQNILSLKITPSLKYNYELKILHLGVNAERIIQNRNNNYKNAVIIITLSFIFTGLYIALYLMDLYKPLFKLPVHYPTNISAKSRNDNIIHNDGIVQLKSHLVNRKRELKSINNILAATIKSQRNFIKVISHDLKAPLRNVSGLVDSIYRKYPDSLNQDVANRLSRIKKNVDKEREMISDILKNITNQKKILAYEKVDVNEIVLSIIEDLGFEIQEKNIEIKIEKKLPFVYSNRIILKHVFQNLLDNACKYFPREGENHIEILYRDNGSDHVFSVKDTGPGISKEIQKTLFHSYDYSQTINTTDEMDSGLGLELVSTFIEIINGKIWLESEIGEGSAFFISLNKKDGTKSGLFE